MDMDSVFSMIDFEGQFWLAPPSPTSGGGPAKREDGSSGSLMNRSSSELEFQRFLEEAGETKLASDVENPGCVPQNGVVLGGEQTVATSASDVRNLDYGAQYGGEQTVARSASDVRNLDCGAQYGGEQRVGYPGGVDSEGYQAYLMAKLDMACAAVALLGVGRIKSRESATVAPHTLSQLPNKRETSQAALALVHDVTKRQDTNAVGPVGLPSLPAVQKQPCIQVISTTSVSSGEQSEDDGEITENRDPADAKRRRRMLSNRESARRSRRRQEALQSELETQASQVIAEHSTLQTKLADLSQKYNETTVDHRILKADVETLLAKVKMAEETLRLHHFMQFVQEISTAVPSSSDTSSDITLPMQDNLVKQQCYVAPANNHMSRDIRMQNSLVDVSPAIGNVRRPPTEAAIANNNIFGTSSLQFGLNHFYKQDYQEYQLG